MEAFKGLAPVNPDEIQRAMWIEEGLTVDELVTESYGTAKAKGWYDPGFTDSSVAERFMLMVSEISEALEEYRNGIPLKEIYYDTHTGSKVRPIYTDEILPAIKPEGVAIELADVVIRVADFCGKQGIDLNRALALKLAYNRTRPYRHGGKAC